MFFALNPVSNILVNTNINFISFIGLSPDFRKLFHKPLFYGCLWGLNDNDNSGFGDFYGFVFTGVTTTDAEIADFVMPTDYHDIAVFSVRMREESRTNSRNFARIPTLKLIIQKIISFKNSYQSKLTDQRCYCMLEICQFIC